MYPYIPLFGLQVPAYGLLLTLGCALACIVAIRRVKKAGLSRDNMIILAVYAFALGLVGAKLLYLATLTPAGWQAVFAGELDILRGGTVYYGGFLGGFLGFFLAGKLHRIDARPYVNCVIVGLPLAHAVGRIGCFMAGCCYGIPMGPPLGIALRRSVALAGALQEVPRFPVQLLESALNFLLFIALLLFLKKKRRAWDGLLFYAASYAVIRFVCEFFRYDAERGVFFGLGLSQWISMAVFLVCSGVLVWRMYLRGRCPHTPTSFLEEKKQKT